MSILTSTRRPGIWMLILSLGAIQVAYAQTESEPDDPVTTIMEESNGNVVIDIPQPILDQILTPVETPKRQNQHLKPGINKMTGYRIQVFSDGRNQGSLEARAKARGSAVLAKFPKYRGQVYTFSQSPSWYTRVGNFRTQQEASEALSELKRAFPSFASEMRVVKCKIVVIKQ